MIAKNIIETIGNTPIVKLNRLGADLPAELYAKIEFLNPGGSIKDRIGYWLIEDAERRGTLKPGGTIVEGTSGNTGFGLAIAAAIKGYRCIFVLPDKMSEEKIRNLRAFGAKVVVTPTAVAPEDPRSYYSVSRRLAQETPNAIYIDQYNNLENRECHYKTTGPEILSQMPDIDVLIAGIGTGGTICGVGRYIKEKKPSCQIVAVDPIGSIVYDFFKTGKIVEAKGYKTEGIGEDFFPKNYDLSVIDDMVQVEDKENFLLTREILTKEGIFAGNSSGAAVAGALRWVKAQGSKMKGKKVLIIFPDSGDRYLSKVFNDDWMREAGFLDEPGLGNADDLLHAIHGKDCTIETASQKEKVSQVIEKMRARGISQLPVLDEREWIKGIVTESAILSALSEGKINLGDSIESLVDATVEFVKLSDSLEKISKMIAQGKVPLVTHPQKEGKIAAIITKIDLLTYLSQRK